ncbi:MAG: helix-turn-helix transcriptional regulator [Alphaproteobacteria bacterium]|nr:helix-turn-helix transcriptional regulator [Alphaproteobacteria bacterium]
MNLLAKPWNGEIIATLHQREGQGGGLRFSEFGDLIGIGDRMLSVRLRELETRGLVNRVVDGGPPVRVSYHLTEVGRGFGGVQTSMSQWGMKLVRRASRRQA